jgi:hypothetical protein
MYEVVSALNESQDHWNVTVHSLRESIWKLHVLQDGVHIWSLACGYGLTWDDSEAPHAEGVKWTNIICTAFCEWFSLVYSFQRNYVNPAMQSIK